VPADYARFLEIPPIEVQQGARTWWVRAQNFYLAYTELVGDAVLARSDQPDEYMVLLPDKQTRIRISAGAELKDVDGYSIMIIPPGKSCIEATGGGRVIRLFSARADDLAVLPSNRASYEKPRANVKPFEPWPKPLGGYRIRAYSLDVPTQPGRFGRIWRCTTFMVNYFEAGYGPRDTAKLSPHDHPDFEQCCLALEGDFIHHLRYPWTSNLAEWRDDEHERCPAPSVVVVPPLTLHTAQGIGVDENQLVDVFCPPRLDFSEKPGWVLNADEYPMP
jgi:hypothetical protein